MTETNRTSYQSQWSGGSLNINPPSVIGTTFFVDSVNGASTNSGSSWDDALATIDAAIAKCTATKGDTIYCAPWHVEDEAVAATDIWTMDVAGVNLIGLRQGNQRPTMSFTTSADATATVSAANCRISGFKFISAVVDLAVGLTVSATGDGLELDHCIFTDGGAALELVIGVSLAAAADGCKIHDNEFYTVPAGGCASGIKLVGESVRTIIENNIIYGDYSDASIDGTTAAATLITIKGNTLMNIDSTAGANVELHTSTTGFVVGNRIMGGRSIADCIICAGACTCDNYSTGVVSASGILAEPAADVD